jgi:hypothetical protein
MDRSRRQKEGEGRDGVKELHGAERDTITDRSPTGSYPFRGWRFTNKPEWPHRDAFIVA